MPLDNPGAAPSREDAATLARNMLRLALPTTAVLLAQTFVGVAETWFVSHLGTAALAGATLVFPAYMLMQMTANGGMGGGVSSAVARALGARDRRRAEALAFHGLLLAVAFGAIFSAGMWLGGPALYRALGGSAASLSAALAYSNAAFAGAVAMWISALLGAALRGAGEARVPATISLAGLAMLLPLSPALIFGWGPFPRLGMAGAGVAMVAYALASSLALLAYMRSPRAALRLAPAPLERRHFRDILGVGGLSSIGTAQANLTVALATAAVGRYAPEAVAGFGIGSRLDYLLIPLLFGFGTALVTLVGRSVGAGDLALARRTAWTGGLIAAGATQAIGIAAAVFAPGWASLFTQDPAVAAITVAYLRIVAPFYGLFGLGMALYFAGQGARRVGWPLAAGTLRLVVVGLAGALSARFALPIAAPFGAIAASLAAFGAVTAVAWLPARARAAPPARCALASR